MADAEKLKFLEQQLDQAMHAYAEFEEEWNRRMQQASESAQRDALFGERSEVEETLGIVTLLDEIDRLKRAG